MVRISICTKKHMFFTKDMLERGENEKLRKRKRPRKKTEE